MKEDLETLRKTTLIRVKLQCKHSIAAEVCDKCKGVTREGKEISEVIDELEKSGFLKKIRSAQKLGRIVGKTAFWVGKGILAGGMSYVIFTVGKEIFAYTKSKRRKKQVL